MSKAYAKKNSPDQQGVISHKRKGLEYKKSELEWFNMSKEGRQELKEIAINGKYDECIKLITLKRLHRSKG